MPALRSPPARASEPDLGVYLSPEPDHRTSVMSYVGPQAYAYANGRPLGVSDPDGRYARVCCDGGNKVEITAPAKARRWNGSGWTDAPGEVAAIEKLVRSYWMKAGKYSLDVKIPLGEDNMFDLATGRSGQWEDGHEIVGKVHPGIPGNKIIFWSGAYYDKTTVPAHEFGHLVGLTHEPPGNLMYPGGDTGLSGAQIEKILRLAGISGAGGCGDVGPKYRGYP